MVSYCDECVARFVWMCVGVAWFNTRACCTASPGSRSAPSRAALGALVERLQQCGMSVCVNGELVSEVALALPHATEGDPDSLLPLAKEDFVATDKTPELAIEFGKLAEMKETAFQQGPLKENLFDIKWARAHDLSTSNHSTPGPFFKPAQMVGDASVCHLSAKPDGTSLVAPMDLEIKSDLCSGGLAEVDWRVLDQAVERVLMRLRMAGFLSCAVAFAVTGRSAWCVVGERRFESRQEIQQLNVCRVSHSAVALLWGAVTRRAAREPHFFLTADGPCLLRSLCAAGLEPWACRVKWLASSMSNVYGITLPQQFKLGNNMCRGVDCRPTSVTFVVKVVCGGNADLFTREAFALQKMADASPEFEFTFYALGCFPDDEESKNPGSPFHMCFGFLSCKSLFFFFVRLS